ncbi:protein FAR-RED IMPAIRED RESPONSE 1-like [Silene latifolia]|uniref:protein FAR-RED IMPAIRED RESPONSE 1-like n=1 Tax=Silene latifolia TaxID=37657 RepID=UPI003D77C7BD
MFDDGHHWIPAYHRDLALGCILRTTQRSESTNSFFKRYENHFGTLVEFWMRFQTAMDQQRYTRRCDDYNNDHSFPELKTKLPIEKHDAIIYTHAKFKVFQEEVMAADSCGVDDFEKEEHVRIIHVIDLCERQHIVWVYKGKGIGRIPSKYIVDRWLNNTHAANSSSSEVTIHPPEQARNKGSGKRLKSAKQQAIEKAAKPKRLCAYCKEIVNHDRRTCPLHIADEAAEKAAKKKKV